MADWPHHHEHLILDWSSAEPLLREQLPNDHRLRLIRVDGERDWHLCRAYNLALQLARGSVLFKLDAIAGQSPTWIRRSCCGMTLSAASAVDRMVVWGSGSWIAPWSRPWVDSMNS